MSLSHIGALVLEMLRLEVFCTQFACWNEGCDDNKSGSDDNADKGDYFCQYNDRQGSTLMEPRAL